MQWAWGAGWSPFTLSVDELISWDRKEDVQALVNGGDDLLGLGSQGDAHHLGRQRGDLVLLELCTEVR